MGKLEDLTAAYEKAEREGNLALQWRYREEIIAYALECEASREAEKRKREEKKKVRALAPKRELALVPYGHCNRCPWCGWTLGAKDRRCTLRMCGLGQRLQEYKKKRCAGCGARYDYAPKRGERHG